MNILFFCQSNTHQSLTLILSSKNNYVVENSRASFTHPKSACYVHYCVLLRLSITVLLNERINEFSTLTFPVEDTGKTTNIQIAPFLKCTGRSMPNGDEVIHYLFSWLIT